MQDDSAARGDLKAAEAQLHEAMRAHAAQLQSRPAAAAIDAAAPRNDAPVKVKIRVTLDEVSLRLTCSGKGLNKSLLDACVVPFLGAYNKRVETHKQCTLGELMSAKINGDMLGPEDLKAEARYILGRAAARAQDNGKTTDGEEDDILMVLGTRATHEREWVESGRPGPWDGRPL